jgi:transposase
MNEPIDNITGGVDTHKDNHVAAALDPLGGVLGTATFPATRKGYTALLAWLRSFGTIVAVGVEGTGSWGAGLARFLATAEIKVIEINRPDRQARRRHGKNDTVDAIAAARAVLSGDATSIPKTAGGNVECIRLLRVARRSAIHARTQAVNQFQSIVDTAPDELRAELSESRGRSRFAKAARFHTPSSMSPRAAAKVALCAIARRWIALDAEIHDLDVHLRRLVKETAPVLVARHAVGPDTAGALLVAAGDNPERLRNEASFASLCGASPVEASSGRTNRHRLNRGGNREANSALWRIVLVRMNSEDRTKRYVERRTKEGLSKIEIMRCLKRYVAREIYRDLRAIVAPM